MTEKSKKDQLILDVRDLKAYFDTPEGIAKAVNGISFSIRKGEIFGLVGESGSGKTVTALSILRLLQKPAGYIAGGEIHLGDQNLLDLPLPEMRKVRGARVSMIFQEPMTSLNPVFTVGNQVAEAILLHDKGTKRSAMQKTLKLFMEVGIPAPEQRIHEYPHQLSGGMKQRVMIAMALACQPDLIVADEPTTALDVTTQAQVLAVLKELKTKKGASILLVTHNLGLVRQYADRVGVMYAGKIVEIADTRTLLNSPCHPYTQKLLESIPSRATRGKDLNIIQGNVPAATEYGEGCTFLPRCPVGDPEICGKEFPPVEEVKPGQIAACYKKGSYVGIKNIRPSIRRSDSSSEEEILVEAREVDIHFPIKKGFLKKTVGYVKAVDGFSLKIPLGKTTALVGESGCGKTTFGKALVNLLKIRQGEIQYGDTIIQGKGKPPAKFIHQNIQMIFQDPYSSLNPRMKVADLVSEGVKAQGIPFSDAKLTDLLIQAGLPPDSVFKYPHEFSGGQRQRICIARALAVEPNFLICDEATSALDVSVQAQILNTLRSIQKRKNLTYLFITHDLGVVEYLADYIAVMYLGRIVEEGPLEEVLDNPRHPYTQALLSAVPRVEEDTGKEKIFLEGDVPSPINPPSGCHFHPRCPHATSECQTSYPPIHQEDSHPSHHYRCYHPVSNLPKGDGSPQPVSER